MNFTINIKSNILMIKTDLKPYIITLGIKYIIIPNEVYKRTGCAPVCIKLIIGEIDRM